MPMSTKKIEELKARIDAIFEKHTHQSDVLIDIYKMYFPRWDEIAKIDGWPKCGKPMALYICGKFMEFDRKFHPDVMNGGLWLNNGFSHDEKLGDWEVNVQALKIEYIEKQEQLELLAA